MHTRIRHPLCLALAAAVAAPLSTLADIEIHKPETHAHAVRVLLVEVRNPRGKWVKFNPFNSLRYGSTCAVLKDAHLHLYLAVVPLAPDIVRVAVLARSTTPGTCPYGTLFDMSRLEWLEHVAHSARKPKL